MFLSVVIDTVDRKGPTLKLHWMRTFLVHCTVDVSAIHCKKELAIFPSPAGMSLTKLSLGGKKLNYSRPGRV
jgi:hypothetical protein